VWADPWIFYDRNQPSQAVHGHGPLLAGLVGHPARGFPTVVAHCVRKPRLALDVFFG
jgi:hypothetical protein